MCLLKVTGLEIVTPDGGTFGPGAPMTLRARLTTSASVTLPTTLSVEAAAFPTLTSLSQSGGEYSAAAVAPSGSSGMTSVKVKTQLEDAGFEATVMVNVDTTAPTVSLSVVSAPGRVNGAEFTEQDSVMAGAFKRDEFAEVQVASSEAVAFALADFTGVPMSALSPTACTTACVRAVCECVSVDVAKLPMNDFRKTFSIGLSPRRDMYGNASDAIPDANFAVTRFRWSRAVAATTPVAIHAPALSSNGVVYAGIVQTPSSGAVVAVTPTGALLAGFDGGAQYGAITTSPVIGDSLYVAYKSATDAAIRAVSVSTGGPVSPARCADPARLYKSSLSLVDMAAADERIVAVSQNGVLVGARPTASVGNCFEASVPSLTGSNRYSVVAEDGEAFLATTSSATLTRVSSPVSLVWGTPQTTNQHNLFTDALVRSGTVIGGGGLTVGGVYAMTESSFSSAPAKFTLDGGAPGATGPALAGSAASPVFVYGNGSQVVSVPRTAGNPGGFGLATSRDLVGGSIVGTPVIGSDGSIHVVDSDGRVTALTSSLTPLWSADVAGTVDSSLTLDSARDSTGGIVCSRPGSLYVVSTGDGKLYSIIVDSHGLSSTAPWPTYQHDNARTGNQTRSTADWACPP
ncbi:MAG: hypothetical protein DI536_36205 [Archangium gephyra]|uniref:Uncharacterized protein n=1 Tax=Archangium gephyra TaxID=48 RepID=A0A2W5UZR1_9BACT|nr:MAG: hypothetical protein DI536_36205 [Archangium gephyra]